MRWYFIPLAAIAAFALAYGLADALLSDTQDAQGQVNAAQEPAFTLVFSKDDSRSSPEGLEGKTVDGDIFVFIDPDDGVDEVDFLLDGVLETTDRHPPFDFKGGSAAKPKALHTAEIGDGQHIILAQMLMLDGSTQDVSATFTVLNNAPTPTPTPPGISDLEYVTNVSPSDGSSPKVIEAACPAGKMAIGGGGAITQAFGDVAVNLSAPSVGLDGWRFGAHEVTGTTDPWSIEAWAACAVVP